MKPPCVLPTFIAKSQDNSWIFPVVVCAALVIIFFLGILGISLYRKTRQDAVDSCSLKVDTKKDPLKFHLAPLPDIDTELNTLYGQLAHHLEINEKK